MAYADRMTTAMLPLAIKWYDGVKAHFLAKWPGTLPTLQTLIKRVEAPVLEGFYRRSLQPCVSADFFRWSVARATWHELCKYPPSDSVKPLKLTAVFQSDKSRHRSLSRVKSRLSLAPPSVSSTLAIGMRKSRPSGIYPAQEHRWAPLQSALRSRSARPSPRESVLSPWCRL